MLKESMEDVVKSCFNKTYRPLEVVVVNDGSTDSTFEVVRSLFNSTTVGEAQVKLLDIVSNKGAANALRVGFSRSKGAYVCWLSADDMFIDRKKIEKQVAWMARTGALWSYHRNAYQTARVSTSQVKLDS
jgi:teichuronic acid biosynthesis glycosyltransferase TuaG